MNSAENASLVGVGLQMKKFIRSIYKKMNKQLIMSAPQDEESIHYSTGIPSKNPDDYELFKTFPTFTKMKNWIEKNYNLNIDKDQFFDKHSRDIFGDYVCALKKSDFDLAIRQSGDFLLYFDSPQTNEVRELVKARAIWDQFIEGNYKTAEPGLIFWSTMSNYSPSNYCNCKCYRNFTAPRRAP